MGTEWMIREDQLDPDQQEFVNTKVKSKGNIWIQGFAGSGKSVLLIHSLLDTIRKEPGATICIVVYTHSLIDMFQTGMKELKFPKKIPVVTYHEFQRKGLSFDYIFCDEVQDLPEDVVTEMNRRSKKVIVAGDTNQSIYEDRVVPAQIERILSAEPYVLTIIHRLSRSIISLVQSLIPRMDIWRAKRDQTKVDVEVRYCVASSRRKEIEYVWKEATNAVRYNSTAVVLLPSHKKILEFINQLCDNNNTSYWVVAKNSYGKPDYNDLNRFMRSKGLNLEYVGNSYGSFQNAIQQKNVILMTYHSSKGMDFENVFMPLCETPMGLMGDAQETVFMVALTRSRKNLYVSYSSTPYHLLEKIKSVCRYIDIDRELAPQQASSSSQFGF